MVDESNSEPLLNYLWSLNPGVIKNSARYDLNRAAGYRVLGRNALGVTETTTTQPV
jgi:hypothetical protein